MELPKIKNEDLPKELKEILGDNDAEFDAIVDPKDVISLDLDPEAYFEERSKIAKKLVESRKKSQEYLRQQRLENRNNKQV
mgnify:CR=1 FL=1|jgi:hypothetical protein|tara:strand:+ start:1244 stop:1486 length:243 start_codon:yes stop_codon:yes gene_type:complete